MFADLSVAQLFMFLVHYPIQILVVLTALALACRWSVRDDWAWAVTACGLLAFVLGFLFNPPGDIDLKVFWTAGCDTWNGVNPYERMHCLNPPTAFPLYALLALFPFPAVWLGWAIFNAIGCALLPFLAQAALRGNEGNDWQLPWPTLGVLSAASALSVSTRYLIDVGQISLLITLLALVVVQAYVRCRPIQAGLGLALMSIKPTTMLPFLLLFTRRRDLKTWVVLALVGFGLYFLANPAGELATRLGDCLRNISAANLPGKMNDYPGGIGVSLISLDRAIHYLGITERSTVAVITYLTLLTLVAWVGWQVRGPRPLPPAAAACLLAFLASIFLYHRVYDLPLLVLPLVYALGRARAELGWSRWLYSATVGLILGSLFMRLEIAGALTMRALGPNPPSPWLQALVIPHAIWFVLLGMACLSAAEYWRQSGRAADTKLSYQRVAVEGSQRWDALREQPAAAQPNETVPLT